MVVFHFFKIVKLVPNRATHHIQNFCHVILVLVPASTLTIHLQLKIESPLLQFRIFRKPTITKGRQT